MGLIVTPVTADGSDAVRLYWPHYTYRDSWSGFLCLTTILRHNALLASVAKEDDAAFQLLGHIPLDTIWTPVQCRDVHRLILRTIDACYDLEAERTDDSDGDMRPTFAIPPGVNSHYCFVLFERILAFAQCLAVYYANDWHAGFY